MSARKEVKECRINLIANGYTVYHYIFRESPYFSESKNTYFPTFEEAIGFCSTLEKNCVDEFLALEAPKSEGTPKSDDIPF